MYIHPNGNYHPTSSGSAHTNAPTRSNHVTTSTARYEQNTKTTSRTDTVTISPQARQLQQQGTHHEGNVGKAVGGSLMMANGAELAAGGLEIAATGVGVIPGLIVAGVGLGEMAAGGYLLSRR